ncbi:MAG: FecCD family ABC transporter permease [Phascolarctobacterium faecium]
MFYERQSFGTFLDHVYIITVYAFWSCFRRMLYKNANILQLGDEMAQSLGVNVTFVRIFLSAVAAFLAAATVAEAGMIGFVGLVVPHIARMMVGSDYKALLPVSMLLGAVILLAADTLGRTLIPGMEIPVGIVMAVTGGPFFLYMLRKKGKVSGS